jgi:thiol-disulfide isomerase/thioredoxin
VSWKGPALTLSDCAGEDRSLEALVEGADALVAAIGAAWCGPCQKDAPVLEAFHQEHPGLAVVQVLVQDATGNPATHLACEEWAAAFGLSYPVLVDPLYLSEHLVGADGFPAHLVWRADGSQVYRQNGAFDGDAVLASLE